MKSEQSNTNVNLANFGGEGEGRDMTQTSLTAHEIKNEYSSHVLNWTICYTFI